MDRSRSVMLSQIPLSNIHNGRAIVTALFADGDYPSKYAVGLLGLIGLSVETLVKS